MEVAEVMVVDRKDFQVQQLKPSFQQGKEYGYRIRQVHNLR